MTHTWTWNRRLFIFFFFTHSGLFEIFSGFFFNFCLRVFFSQKKWQVLKFFSEIKKKLKADDGRRVSVNFISNKMATSKVHSEYLKPHWLTAPPFIPMSQLILQHPWYWLDPVLITRLFEIFKNSAKFSLELLILLSTKNDAYKQECFLSLEMGKKHFDTSYWGNYP